MYAININRTENYTQTKYKYIALHLTENEKLELNETVTNNRIQRI